MRIMVLTYNTLFAGRDNEDDRRERAQITLMNELQPDEAKALDDKGGRRLFEWKAVATDAGHTTLPCVTRHRRRNRRRTSERPVAGALVTRVRTASNGLLPAVLLPNKTTRA